MRKSSISWRELVPKTKKERQSLPRKCFLDPNNLKYPICAKHTRKPSCIGLRAASRRASLQRNASIHKKAEDLLTSHNCKKSMRKEKAMFLQRKNRRS